MKAQQKETRKSELDAIFLFFHSSMSDTFRSAVQLANCSGDLLALGWKSKVIECFLEVEDKSQTEKSLGELVSLLQELNPKVIVLHEVPLEEIFGLVRNACPEATIILLDPFEKFDPACVDYVLHDLNHSPFVVQKVCDAILKGEDLRYTKGLTLNKQGHITEIAPSKDAVRPRMMHESLPDADRIYLPKGFRPALERVTTYINPGCPYSRPVRVLKEFEGVRVEGTVARGCSFCHMGGDYESLPLEDTVQRVLEEFLCYKRRNPKIKEVILRDQLPYPYLRLLVRALKEANLCGTTILFSVRPDYFVRFKEKVVEAIKECEGTDIRLNLYLIGFENFSPKELKLYNKGVTRRCIYRCVAVARELANLYPKNFTYDEYKTSSFILFSPWTELEDLEQNIEAFRDLDITEFSVGMPLTKLRLYPNLPLYWKAKKEGLLVDEYPEEESVLDCARRFGYSAEHPWRFKDKDAEKVYKVYASLVGFVPRRAQVALLDLIVRLFRENRRLEEEAVIDAFESLIKATRKHEQRGADSVEKTEELILEASCNNGCKVCLRDIRVFEPSEKRLEQKVFQLSKGATRLFITGREPTISPLFLQALEKAKKFGFKSIEVETNGRLFAYKNFLWDAKVRGLTAVRVKIFGHRKEVYEGWTRDRGSFEQLLIALSHLRRAGDLKLSCVIPVFEENLHCLQEIVGFCETLGVRSKMVAIPIVGLPVRGFLDFLLDLVKIIKDLQKSKEGLEITLY
jgi:radical SAM superfamily enzyme YgiQ (UPF0313 family)